jgi:cell division protease FtsH
VTSTAQRTRPAGRRSSSNSRRGPGVGASPAAERLKAVFGLLLKDPLALLLALASIALTILFFSLLGSTQPSSSGTQIPLSEVHRLAADRALAGAELLDHDSRVVLQTDDGRTLWAAYPASDVATEAVRRDLQERGVTVTVDQQSSKGARQLIVQFFLPIVLLVCLFAFFTRIGQGGGAASGFAAFSKFGGNGKKKGKATGSLGFAQVAGADEAVVELKEIRDYLADPGRYARLGARAPKGVLLVGPPGTGKTLLARATAGEADAAFFSLSGSDFVESLVGVGAARVRDLFAKARRMAPAIIFIDEIDAAGRKRGAGVGQGNDEREQTLNQLLVEMDGFGGDAGLVVMAATNRPDILDPALLRPGRFDRQVTVDVPDVHGRHEILGLYLKGRPLEREVEILEIARLCPGFSGAELANVVNEAALLAVRDGRAELSRADLEEGIERVVSGPARKGHVMSEDERWTVAIHEASHAVVARSIGQTTSVQKLSIVARGRQLGTSAQQLVDRDMTIVHESDLNRQLVTVMAGCAGEQRAFGEVSSGVGDDLHVATNLARTMVTSYGMSRALGRVTLGEKQENTFLGDQLGELGSVGPETLNLIDNEVERMVADAEAKAAHVLERAWSAVEETATSLLERESLSGVALEALLSTVPQIPLDALDEVVAPAREGGASR